jgi:hypothetical protein
MNNEYRENGAMRGPLIFTLPASGFVVILRLDWLEGTARAAVSAKCMVGRGIGCDRHQRLLDCRLRIQSNLVVARHPLRPFGQVKTVNELAR